MNEQSIAATPCHGSISIFIPISASRGFGLFIRASSPLAGLPPASSRLTLHIFCFKHVLAQHSFKGERRQGQLWLM